MDTPKGYVSPDYLQSVGAFLGQLKQRTYACMKIGQGATVLDVGCGSGLDTVAMAHIVGPTGQVFGVDHDPGMLAEADQRARNENAGAWVQHRQADATSLPFEGGTFDACRSERLFQHLPDAAAALNEMSRVTKPGGMVVALDTDWGSLSTDTTEVDVERRLSRFHAEQLTANGLLAIPHAADVRTSDLLRCHEPTGGIIPGPAFVPAARPPRRRWPPGRRRRR